MEEQTCLHPKKKIAGLAPPVPSPSPHSFLREVHKLLPLLFGIRMSHAKALQLLGGISHSQPLQVGMPGYSKLADIHLSYSIVQGPSSPGRSSLLTVKGLAVGQVRQ